MTIDFRPPEEQGRAPTSPPGVSPVAPQAARRSTPAAQRLALGAIRTAGLLFIMLGTLALWVRPAFLGADLAPYIGGAMIVAGVFDFIVAGVLRVVWQRASAQGVRNIPGKSGAA